MTATVTIALAFAVGVSLGLLGGGGSVLSVPLLVYVAGWNPHQATTGSLFVVGVTSAIGLLWHARAGRVRWRTGLVFGLAGMAGAYTGGLASGLVPGAVLLISFAALMVAASAGMIRGRRGEPAAAGADMRLLPALGLGAIVGAVTGFVGAGGGFVIVPALVLVAGLSMPEAVGTSLLVIAMQSGAGLAGHLARAQLPWALTLAVTAMAVAGSLAGGRFTGRIPASALRRGFGILVLLVALLVLVEQVPGAALHQIPRVAVPVLAIALPVLAVLAVTTGLARRRGHRAGTPRSIR